MYVLKKQINLNAYNFSVFIIIHKCKWGILLLLTSNIKQYTLGACEYN